jgi:thiol-disulfide isomerase/thioredoxin
MNRRRAVWMTFVALAALSLGAGLYFGERYWHASDPVAGQSASTLLALSLPDEQGAQQSLNQWRGKVLVVNFWATWCAPCREEMPEFVRIQNELGPKGIQFVGIAADQVDKVQQFTRELGLNYPALIGGFEAIELSRAFGNRLMVLPFTVIVARNGTIAYAQHGPLRKDRLQQIVGPLL